MDKSGSEICCATRFEQVPYNRNAVAAIEMHICMSIPMSKGNSNDCRFYTIVRLRTDTEIRRNAISWSTGTDGHRRWVIPMAGVTLRRHPVEVFAGFPIHRLGYSFTVFYQQAWTKWDVTSTPAGPSANLKCPRLLRIECWKTLGSGQGFPF